MPLTARLNVQVIYAINSMMSGARRADSERDLEVGGILLGAVDDAEGVRPTVRIERFDPVDCEHRRGSSYVLTDRDKKVLAKKLEWWIRHGTREGMRPVGFFRTHTRRGLYVDNEDFTLFQHYFPEPASVFLMIRPMAGAENVGGFFFWEEGDMHREASYQEFPFHEARLPLVDAETPAREPVPAPATALAAQPVVQAAPPPPPPPPAGISSSSAPPALSAPPTLVAAPPASAAPSPSAAAASAAVPPSRLVPPPRSVPPSRAVLPSRAVSPASALPLPPAERRIAPWAQLAVPLAIGVLLGVAVFEVTTHGRATQPPQTAVTTPRANPAPAPEPAKAPATAPVEKPSPLAKSKIVSAPPTAPVAPPPKRVVAQVEKPAGSAAPASPTGSASRTEAAVTPATIPAAVPEKTQVAEATPPPAPEPLVPIATPARVEHTRRPTAMATVTVEPLTGSKIGRLVGKISPFRRKKQGFVPARAIHQVTPAVPANEHLERDVPVDLRVTVDPAGNVSEVEQASRNADRQLVRLASDAARSWQFVPARNNDETVTSELILHFRFPGSRNE